MPRTLPPCATTSALINCPWTHKSGYLRALFVQAAWVVLIKPQSWARHGFAAWIETAKKRLHRNVLAVALANKLARIAWAVLVKGRGFEAHSTRDASSQPV
jgi:hypothetical protein